MKQIYYKKFVANLLQKICGKFITKNLWQIYYKKFVANLLQKIWWQIYCKKFVANYI